MIILGQNLVVKLVKIYGKIIIMIIYYSVKNKLLIDPLNSFDLIKKFKNILILIMEVQWLMEKF